MLKRIISLLVVLVALIAGCQDQGVTPMSESNQFKTRYYSISINQSDTLILKVELDYLLEDPAELESFITKVEQGGVVAKRLTMEEYKKERIRFGGYDYSNDKGNKEKTNEISLAEQPSEWSFANFGRLGVGISMTHGAHPSPPNPCQFSGSGYFELYESVDSFTFNWSLFHPQTNTGRLYIASGTNPGYWEGSGEIDFEAHTCTCDAISKSTAVIRIGNTQDITSAYVYSYHVSHDYAIIVQ